MLDVYTNFLKVRIVIQIKKNRKNILPFLIFSFFFLIFLTSSGGHTDPTDGPLFFLVAENFVINGSPSLNENSPSANELGVDIGSEIDKFAFQIADFKANKIFAPEDKAERDEFVLNYTKNIDRENFFSLIYLVLPILVSPLYLIANTFDIPAIQFVSLITNSSIIAAICVTIFFLGKELFKSAKIGFVLSLIFGVCTFVWPYITSLWANPLALLLVTLSIYLIIIAKNKKEKIVPLLAGICMGLAIL